MNQPLGPLSLLGLVLLGIALLWAMRLAYGARRSSSDDDLRLVLTIAAWVMIVVGLVGGTVQLLVYLAPVGCVIVLGILMMAVAHCRSLERRTLLWTLAGAARKGIPLDEAAMAFAAERPNEIGIRAERLADLLRSGVPLPEALERSRTRLPIDMLLAVRLGTESGNLSASIRCIAKLDDDLDSLIRSMFEKYFYLVMLLLTFTVMMPFMMLQIIPMYSAIFQDFDLDLPAATELVIAGSDLLAQFWFLIIPMLIVMPLCLVLSWDRSTTWTFCRATCPC